MGVIAAIRNAVSFGSVPFMGRAEVDMILGYLEPTHVMLEWGSGTSTIFYGRRVSAYYAIEHHQTWARRVQRRLAELDLEGSVQVFHAAPNQPLDGVPNYARSPEGRRQQFCDYIDKVDELGVERFDRVLIDGRSRPECAEKIRPYLGPSSLVFIHDYFNTRYHRRAYHQAIDAHYETVDKVETGQSLVVLRPRDR